MANQAEINVGIFITIFDRQLENDMTFFSVNEFPQG